MSNTDSTKPFVSRRGTVTPFNIKVLGAPKQRLGDLYHRFLRVSWGQALSAMVVVFLSINLVFAAIYDLIGGIEHARPGSYADAFFFSVQTMATIGYGDMHPSTTGANCVMVTEAMVSLLVTALVTGLMFAKFSVSNARIVFTREVAIHPMDDVPTLTFRLGNARGNQIVEAQLRVVMMRTETTKEGVVFYRMYDLALRRERSQAFTRSWTALHAIDDKSPLFGATPESLVRDEIELIVSVIGIDDTSMQQVHARHTYDASKILFGARHVDILLEQPNGDFVLDLTRFQDLQPTTPTATFPYPA
ncbi:MAG: ion channel [Polyangia bacterium]